MVHVWNVSQLLTSGIKADDMLTAIETGLALVKSAPEKVELRFHEATGLVMGRGNGEQISTIDQVISELKETAQIRSNAVDRDRQLEEAQRVLEEAEKKEARLLAAQREQSSMKMSRDAALQEAWGLQSKLNNSMQRMRELEHAIADLQRQLEEKKQGDE